MVSEQGTCSKGLRQFSVAFSSDGILAPLRIVYMSASCRMRASVRMCAVGGGVSPAIASYPSTSSQSCTRELPRSLERKQTRTTERKWPLPSILQNDCNRGTFLLECRTCSPAIKTFYWRRHLMRCCSLSQDSIAPVAVIYIPPLPRLCRLDRHTCSFCVLFFFFLVKV